MKNLQSNCLPRTAATCMTRRMSLRNQSSSQRQYNFCTALSGGTASRQHPTTGQQQQQHRQLLLQRCTPSACSCGRIVAPNNCQQQFRSMASNSSSKELERMENSFLRQRTRELCDEQLTPVGSFTNPTWLEAVQEIIPQWTQMGTWESVQSSFMLLERCLVEQQQQQALDQEHQPPTETEPTLSPSVSSSMLMPTQLLQTSLLNSILANWSTCWVDSFTTTAQSTSKPSLLTPSHILCRIDQYRSQSSTALQPDARTYRILMNATLEASSADTSLSLSQSDLQFVQKVFDQMCYESDHGQLLSPVDTSAYNVMIRAYSSAGQGHQAEKLMNEMFLQAKTNPHVRPVVETVNTVISALAKSINHDGSTSLPAPERAEALLRKMRDLSAEGWDHLLPDTVTYNAVLHCWASYNHPTAGQRAQALFHEMERFYQAGDNHLQPDTISCNTVINAWAQSGNAKQAEALLKRMYDGYLYHHHNMTTTTNTTTSLRTPEWVIPPDVQTFNTVLQAWSRSKNRHAPERAEAMLKQMKKLASSTDLNNLQPDTISYNVVLNCWAQSGLPHAGERAQLILDEMMESGGQVAVDNISYNSVLNAYAKSGKAKQAEQLLFQMKHPDTISYNTVLNAWAQLGQAPHAETLLQKMLQDETVSPNVNSLNTVLKAWMIRTKQQKQPQNTPEQAEALLNRIQTLAAKAGQDELETSITKMQPNVISYNTVLHCWAMSGRKDAGERAETTLTYMESGKGGHLTVQPDTVSYSTTINAYAKSGDAKRAEALLQRMLDHQDPKVKPNVQAFTTVLTAWSRSKDPKAPFRAQELLQRMRDLARNPQFENLQPDVYCYTAVLQCWATSRRRDSTKHMEALLQAMEDGNKNKATGAIVKPNTVTYNIVLNGLARKGLASQAEGLFQRMCEEFHQDSNVRPDVHSFTGVLNAWAKSKEPNAPERAEALLKRMQELSSDSGTVGGGSGVALDVAPDVVCYNIVLNCWARSGRRDAGERAAAILAEMDSWSLTGDYNKNVVKPNAISYNTVITALARSGNFAQAEAHLQRMVLEYQRGNKMVKPTVETVNAVLSAFSKSKQMNQQAANRRVPEQAEEILRRIQSLSRKKTDDGANGNGLDIDLNVITYNIVLNCWANSERAGAGERAEAILEEMERQAEAGNRAVKPNTISYSTTIQAWAKTGNAKRAEALLERMLVDFRKGNHPEVEPNVQTFTSVLTAMARSKEPDAPERAEELLSKMQQLATSKEFNDVTPDTVCYITVLHCWARSGRKDAGERSEALLAEMERRAKADPSFGKMLSSEMLPYKIVKNIWDGLGDSARASHILVRMNQETQVEVPRREITSAPLST